MPLVNYVDSQLVHYIKDYRYTKTVHSYYYEWEKL